MRALLLGLLVALPVGQHGAGRGRDDVPEDVRVPDDELVVHLAGDVGEVEQALLFGQAGVEEHLAEQVAQLF